VALVRTVALFPTTSLVESVVRLVTLCGYVASISPQCRKRSFSSFYFLLPHPLHATGVLCQLFLIADGPCQGVYYIGCSYFQVTKRHSASRQTIRALVVSNASMARDVYHLCALSRQHFSALPFATVVDCVFRTNIAPHDHGKHYLVIRRECRHSNNIETLGHAILICKIQYFLVNYLFPYKYTTKY
jgi:hypothetical protein